MAAGTRTGLSSETYTLALTMGDRSQADILSRAIATCAISLSSRRARPARADWTMSSRGHVAMTSRLLSGSDSFSEADVATFRENAMANIAAAPRGSLTSSVSSSPARRLSSRGHEEARGSCGGPRVQGALRPQRAIASAMSRLSADRRRCYGPHGR